MIITGQVLNPMTEQNGALPGELDALIASGIRAGDLYVASSSVHDRGVFAARDFAAGSVVEVCPVIIVPAAQRPALDTTLILDHYYVWGDDAAVALGFGSLYNHSYQPNTHYLRDFPRRLIVVAALRDIAGGEEITINYNGDPASQRQLPGLPPP